MQFLPQKFQAPYISLANATIQALEDLKAALTTTNATVPILRLHPEQHTAPLQISQIFRQMAPNPIAKSSAKTANAPRVDYADELSIAVAAVLRVHGDQARDRITRVPAEEEESPAATRV